MFGGTVAGLHELQAGKKSGKGRERIIGAQETGVSGRVRLTAVDVKRMRRLSTAVQQTTLKLGNGLRVLGPNLDALFGVTWAHSGREPTQVWAGRRG